VRFRDEGARQERVSKIRDKGEEERVYRGRDEGALGEGLGL
jgi:hypothetical protein